MNKIRKINIIETSIKYAKLNLNEKNNDNITSIFYISALKNHISELEKLLNVIKEE